MILGVRTAQVGTKNRSKIDIKNDAETEGLGNQIFNDFGAMLALQNEAKTFKNRC